MTHRTTKTKLRLLLPPAFAGSASSPSSSPASHKWQRRDAIGGVDKGGSEVDEVDTILVVVPTTFRPLLGLTVLLMHPRELRVLPGTGCGEISPRLLAWWWCEATSWLPWPSTPSLCPQAMQRAWRRALAFWSVVVCVRVVCGEDQKL